MKLGKNYLYTFFFFGKAYLSYITTIAWSFEIYLVVEKRFKRCTRLFRYNLF